MPHTQQSSSKQNWSEQAQRFNTQWELTPWGKWKVMWVCIDCFVRAQILQILCNGCHVRSPSSVRLTCRRPDCEISSTARLTEIYQPVGRTHKYREEEKEGEPWARRYTDSTRGLIPTEANVVLSGVLIWKQCTNCHITLWSRQTLVCNGRMDNCYDSDAQGKGKCKVCQSNRSSLTLRLITPLFCCLWGQFLNLLLIYDHRNMGLERVLIPQQKCLSKKKNSGNFHNSTTVL